MDSAQSLSNASFQSHRLLACWMARSLRPLISDNCCWRAPRLSNHFMFAILQQPYLLPRIIHLLACRSCKLQLVTVDFSAQKFLFHLRHLQRSDDENCQLLENYCFIVQQWSLATPDCHWMSVVADCFMKWVEMIMVFTSYVVIVQHHQLQSSLLFVAMMSAFTLVDVQQI